MSLPSATTELSPNASAEAAVETLGFASKTTNFGTIANTLPLLEHNSEPPNNWGQETEPKSFITDLNSAEFQLSARQPRGVLDDTSSNKSKNTSISDDHKATVATDLNSAELHLSARQPQSVYDETSSNESKNTAISDDHKAAGTFTAHRYI
jgi:hypothetical protein